MFEKVLRKIGVALGDDDEWSHEKMGVYMRTFAKNQIDFKDYDLVYEEDFQFIKECIVGVDHSTRIQDDYKNCVAPRPLAYDIVSNHESGLDVDKLDYLMRDSNRATSKSAPNSSTCSSARECESASTGTSASPFDKAYMSVLKVFQCR